MFERHPENNFVDINQNVTFECFVSGSNSLLNVTWERNRKQYNSENVENTTTHGNGVSSSLTIGKAKPKDGGKYRCRATNADGESVVSTEAELISKLFYS